MLDTPCWFPAALGSDFQSLTFAHLERETLSKEAFLDHRMSHSVLAWESAPVSEVIQHAAKLPATPPAFIFHSAFCCSTLLARALDVPGKSVALKEPDVLMGLANAVRVGGPEVDSKKLTTLIFSLLARRFEANEFVVIKPTNAANNLLRPAIQSGAPVLILYGDLRSFLVSVLKKGEACKAFVRNQYNIFKLDPGGLASIPDRQAMTFTDLQVAALVWRHQLERFGQIVSDCSANQVATLDFRRLIDDAAATLFAVARHLGLPLDRQTLDEVAYGPVFKRDSKFADRPYNPDQRASDAESVQRHHAEALDQIENWADQLNLGSSLSLPLGNNLDTSGLK
jgi:hypothetical protein